ncbi:hypothetical protein EJ08DRAFT_659943 [Tothia fuscella]|uniref:Zinc finger PHD-type domain-containing protein n=1 Tax=Tothia fuscella TaxID=1048955 RepID=A0A9P4NTH8_9PEZI|nr:hypothetical protein EJ08DRAFT_659943 [Tothia fuscella]
MKTFTNTVASSDYRIAIFQALRRLPASSHFVDAYYTPQITGQQTPAATPTYSSFTINQKSSNARCSPLNPRDPNFHVNHYKQPNLSLPPVEPFRRLSSSPDPLTCSNSLQRSLHSPRSLEAMDSFQMQTPPPTRDSSTRRDFNNGSQHPQTTPVNTYHGELATPGQHGFPNTQTPQFQTPYQYPNLHLSPEMFPFPGGAPQSAPTTQHARYPWDDSPPIGTFGNPGLMDTRQNPFGPSSSVANPNNPGYASWAHNTSHLHPHNSFQQVSMPLSQPNQDPDFWTSGGMNIQPSTSFSQDASFASTTSGVNPNMLFSFSSPLQTMDPSSVRPQPAQQIAEVESRQPYEHQTKEFQRERELAKKSRQLHSRTSTSSLNSSQPASSRPSLQRSNTDSGSRRAQNRSIDSAKSNQGLDGIQRRASPLKRNSQISLSAIPEAVRPRPRTRLVVDAFGRARTEVVPAMESSVPDISESLSRWDDDGESTTDEEEVGITSQRNSFAFSSDSLRRRPSKHARVDSDPDRFDVSKRPVSSASMNSLASRLETTPIGKRSSIDFNYNRRFSSGSFGGSLASDGITPSKDNFSANEISTDAQAALKKVVEGRVRRQEQNDPQALLNAHNQRWSASIDVAKFSAIQEQQRGYDTYSGNFNSSLSPTNTADRDALTPSTDRSTRSNESTRCICNMVEPDGQLMVQCESCTKWLHVRCVGLNELHLPPVYVCVFCTGNTPVARGGRIREPIRRTENYASPLGYKSGQQFRRG